MTLWDRGCGFCDSTIHIDKKIGDTGEAIGVDCAETFIAASREDAAAAGVDNTRFFVADV